MTSIVRTRRSSRPVRLLGALAVAMASPSLAEETVVGFDKGASGGWAGPSGSGGATSVVATGGNPAWNMRTVFNDFGITFRNSTNAAFLGDFAADTSVTISIDLRVESIRFFGQDVSRPWLVELRNAALAADGYPWAGVWFKFAQVSAATHGEWTTFAVTFDPRSETLPEGWGGTGAEDPVTFEPTLPPGVTFRDVLEGVDAVAFTTLEPGYFFGFTDHTLRIDNVRVVRTTAEPADLDGDGTVGATDLAIVLAAWGPCAGAPCPADLDGDGQVNAADLALVLAAWS